MIFSCSKEMPVADKCYECKSIAFLADSGCGAVDTFWLSKGSDPVILCGDEVAQAKAEIDSMAVYYDGCIKREVIYRLECELKK